MSLPVPSPRTSSNGFGFIIIGKSLIIIVGCGNLLGFLGFKYYLTPLPYLAFDAYQRLLHYGRSEGNGF